MSKPAVLPDGTRVFTYHIIKDGKEVVRTRKFKPKKDKVTMCAVIDFIKAHQKDLYEIYHLLKERFPSEGGPHPEAHEPPKDNKV